MIKSIARALMTLAVLVSIVALGSPAKASVPDWDKAITWEQAGLSAQVADALRARGYTVKTPAEWAAIATVGQAPAAPSALAKKAPTDCPDPAPEGQLCLWNGYGWTGTRWDIPRFWLTNGFNGLSFYGSGINNASKGWYNKTYYDVRLFDRDDCQQPSGSWWRNLPQGNVAVSYNADTNDWENRIGSASIVQYAGTYCTNNPNN